MANVEFKRQPLYEVGDVLRFRDFSKIHETAFGWTYEMNRLCGHIFTVKSVEPYNSDATALNGEPLYHSVEGYESGWLISEDMLELVSRAKKFFQAASDEDFELLFKGD